MANAEHNLSLVVKAVDKASGPLRSLNLKMGKLTSPLQNSLKSIKDEFGKDKWLGSLFGGLGRVGGSIGKVGSEATKLGLKLGGLAVAGGFALTSIVHSAVEAGDKLSEMSKRTGLGVDAYASLQFAAAQADVSAEDFNGSMDQLNVRLGQLKQNSGPLKALPAVFKGQLKGAKDTDAAFSLAVKAIGKMKTASEKAALARTLFGKSGIQFGQFLAQGNKSIEEARARFLELAGSQKEFAEGADGLDNAMRETETAVMGLRNAAAGALFPALTDIAKALSTLLAGNRASLTKWAKETGDALLGWVKGGGFDRLISGLRDFASMVGTVVKVLGFGDGLRGTLIGLGLVMGGPLIASIASLGVSLASLAPAIAPFAIAAAPFVLALGGIGAAIYQVVKNWKELKEAVGSDTGIMAWLGDLTGISPLEGQRTKFGSALASGLGAAASTVSPVLGAGINAALGPSRAVASGSAGPQAPAQAQISVDFANLPKGARVSAAKDNTAAVDLSMGYSLVTP